MRQTIDAYLRMRDRGSSISLEDVKRAFAEDPEGFLKSLEAVAEPGTQSSEPMEK